MIWTEPRNDRVRELWSSGHRRAAIARILEAETGERCTPNMIFGRTTRLHLHSKTDPAAVDGLPEHHPAVVAGRTLYPDQVQQPLFPLVTGRNQRKLGGKIEKGPWRGMDLWSLSLEERATCPRSCECWRICYGNTSHLSVRNRHGPGLEARLAEQLARLSRHSPNGFVVRLHQLGDFYSVAYVERWAGWLDQFPQLRVFGYTAWPPDTEIGTAVRALSRRNWARFAIRWSAPAPGCDGRAVTMRHTPDLRALAHTGTIVCPAQTGGTMSCSTCGLCWHPNAMHKTIAFLAHGR